MEDPAKSRKTSTFFAVCLLYGVIGALAAGAWQAATVYSNFGGNWTALFCTGNARTVPPELAARTYTFPDSRGYDGQFYRYVAHDPWLLRGWSQYQDIPLARYRRILVPALAWIAAAGRSAYIDFAYIGVVLLFVFLGVYWLARCAVFYARSPVWGFGFLLLPATIISIDRLTVDVALLALCAGFIWYQLRKCAAGVYAVAAAAALVRETGLLLAAAGCLYALTKRRWTQALGYAGAAIPALIWYRVVGGAIAPNNVRAESLAPAWLFRHPLSGIVSALFGGRPCEAGWICIAARVTETLAILGLVLALALAVWGIWKWRMDEHQWATLLFAGLLIGVSGPRYFADPYGYTRTLSPLVFFVGLRVLAKAPVWVIAPILLADLRVMLQLGRQALGIVRAVW